jgi:Domain of Unknown Function (DUF1080)
MPCSPTPRIIASARKRALLPVPIGLLLVLACSQLTFSQPPPADPASLNYLPGELKYQELFNGKDLTGWVDVNTSPETWSVQDGLLVCKGKPIGVMRSDKQYENFLLHIEWRHMQAGGNSGVFIWSEGKPAGNGRLPKGMEVQMLELEFPKLFPEKDGTPRHLGYVSGELFGANGVKATPENRRGERSMSVEMRCKGKGEWNTYDVVAVNGCVKLSINGKFVNGIRDSNMRKGYLCLESEGSEIHFRNIRIMELPIGGATAEQTAEVVKP